MLTSRKMKIGGVVALVVLVAAGYVAFRQRGGGPGAGSPAGPTGAATCPHDASKEACFICEASLREPGRLWCGEHSRYEDRCWLCHPELQDKKRLWCQEHSLYEDECFLCHPELKKVSREGGAAPSGVVMCREHGVPESECGICHPELTDRLKPGQGVKVRLPSLESAALVGIRAGPPTRGAMAGGVECYVELAFDQNKYAEVTVPVGGVLKEVLVDLGASVTERQPLARVGSASIAEVAAKAVLSHQVLERERALHAKGITSTQVLQEAEAAHRAVCQQLRALGFSEEEVDAMGKQPEAPVLLEIRAPFAGEIVERRAVRGAVVEAGKPLFVVADRQVMWGMLSVPEAVVSQLRVGQTVEVRIDALPGRVFAGTLTWIAADVDEKSRLGRARVELPNPDGVLRARLFGRARVLSRLTEGVWLVPVASIQRVGAVAMVFLRLAEDLFEARAVRTGATHQDLIEVVEGLRAGDRIVGERSFSLKSQLLSSRLGAGCVD